MAAPANSFSGTTPFPASASPAMGFTSATLTDGALAKAPELVAAGSVSADALRSAIVNALGAAGHNSAAQILGTGSCSIDGANLRIEVAGMGKKMLSLTVNPPAEKIIRQELQRLGGPNRFLVLPGEGGAGSSSSISAIPQAGSVEEAALAHPLVERARELFKAEVRSVVDLRPK